MMRFLIALLIGLGLAACTDGVSEFPVAPSAQDALSEDVVVIQLNAENIRSFRRQLAQSTEDAQRLPGSVAWNYRVAPGDILSVLVFNHPELTMPAGPERSAAESGFRVQSDGTFFYPFVGQVQASGLAPEQIRANLMLSLAEYIADPQLEVRVAAFNSQSINITGAVVTPQRLPVTTVPMTLLDAVNAAGGLEPDADPERVTIQRNGRTYNVDLEGFLERGQARNNPMLGFGDVIYIPARAPQEVYILGEVGRPAGIDLDGEELSLTQALARQGGLDELRADARGIFVFRGTNDNMTVFQLSVESPTGFLLGTRFGLEPGDVVYVTRSPRQRWNDTINGLLPTVGAVASTNATVDGL
ncbi:sugar ABC transporter substrate-binding protein [Loktanella sp. 5RATIMAR09]|uniref:polysaccharide biosynthesis/export family protein n=1 Tax=Loktanella sp. 5RATIMAR09 TaxID=1225655 RepID=UPI0006EBB3F7|nr:polysaccharide biosynthesis/export family protein [Loktanella sp. 5RATIMAR09]KQI71370.1 sugar ABC transporter substrate-binding protein [Loktanella sp. 5RATIMAR09]